MLSEVSREKILKKGPIKNSKLQETKFRVEDKKEHMRLFHSFPSHIAGC